MNEARQYPHLIYVLCTGVSMTFWKKVYFAIAIISAMFLLLTLL